MDRFTKLFAEQFDETKPSLFEPNTKFKELDEWDSMMALTIGAMVEEEYDVIINGDDIKEANTVEELYEIVKLK